MKIKTLFIYLVISSLSIIACNQKNNQNTYYSEKKSPEVISKKVIEDLLSREDFMMYISEEVRSVHYAEMCAAFGAARLAGLFNDTITLNKLQERYMKVIDDSIENTANHVDANVYGIFPLEMYIQNKNEIFFKQGMYLADVQWKDTLPNGLTSQARYWIDDVWMIGSIQTQVYRATGDMKYLDRAAKMLYIYLEKLQQPNGLFYHGEDSHFFWGRGNGWVAAGLAEVISELPKDHKYYKPILEGYKKMMYALLKYQADDGMWRQLVDNENSWKETSSTSMFGYAITMGVKRGILPEEEFTPAYQKAWLSLVDYINEQGQVTDVCVGTGKGFDKDYYLARPKSAGDFHGQAPILWFAYSILKN